MAIPLEKLYSCPSRRSIDHKPLQVTPPSIQRQFLFYFLRYNNAVLFVLTASPQADYAWLVIYFIYCWCMLSVMYKYILYVAATCSDIMTKQEKEFCYPEHESSLTIAGNQHKLISHFVTRITLLQGFTGWKSLCHNSRSQIELHFSA